MMQSEITWTTYPLFVILKQVDFTQAVASAPAI